MNRTWIACSVGVMLFTGGMAAAQRVETGFLDRTVIVDGVTHLYQVYVPREYSPSRAWPIILALHGAGERGQDGLVQTEVGLGRAIRRHADRFPSIVVFPQRPLGVTWQGPGAAVALAALEQSRKEFNTDPARVYLTGLSMGGNGAWYLAYQNPDQFAAVVIVCGFVTGRTGSSGSGYAAIASESEGDSFAGVAKRLARLPLWLFHGDADKLVPVDESRKMEAALKAIGANVRYTELPGVGHNAWDPAYDSADLASWLFQQRRPQP